jgi:hypothetical protein
MLVEVLDVSRTLHDTANRLCAAGWALRCDDGPRAARYGWALVDHGGVHRLDTRVEYTCRTRLVLARRGNKLG